jgi:hypothetical protein
MIAPLDYKETSEDEMLTVEQDSIKKQIIELTGEDPIDVLGSDWVDYIN